MLLLEFAVLFTGSISQQNPCFKLCHWKILVDCLLWFDCDHRIQRYVFHRDNVELVGIFFLLHHFCLFSFFLQIARARKGANCLMVYQEDIINSLFLIQFLFEARNIFLGFSVRERDKQVFF